MALMLGVHTHVLPKSSNGYFGLFNQQDGGNVDVFLESYCLLFP